MDKMESKLSIIELVNCFDNMDLLREITSQIQGSITGTLNGMVNCFDRNLMLLKETSAGRIEFGLIMRELNKWKVERLGILRETFCSLWKSE
jgi:hypothetical protein